MADNTEMTDVEVMPVNAQGYRTDWGTSEAKEVLKQDILDKRIEGWRPQQVYNDPNRYNDYYRHYEYKNFWTNLNNLRKALKKRLNKADKHRRSYEGYIAARAYNPNRWDGSEAQTLLRQMVKDKTIENKTFQQIYGASPLFADICPDADVFRDHLAHEKKRHWKHENAQDYSERVRFLRSHIGVTHEADRDY